MLVILIGYPGSQKIVKASKYLTGKYLPGFDITYLNYTGEISGWATYLSNYLYSIPDKTIIFALDDYLVADYVDIDKYRAALKELTGDVVCIKLCKSTAQEHEEYPVTTQYCIWDKKYLIWLLNQVQTPWQFEIIGSRLFNKTVLLRTCLDYFCNSSISGRWEGINLTGLKEEDLKIIRAKYLPDQVINYENLHSNKKVVVFGGSGFLGNYLIERLLSIGYKNISVVGRNEDSLVRLKEKFPYIELIVGDISDKWIVKKAMKGAEEVYLLSALKHVGLAEVEVKSCIATNISGCMNVIDESLNTRPKLLMFISTDKASQPMGVYGCSKRIGEKLMAEAEKINPETKYRIVRYGNVWKSNGSISTKWKPKMLRGEEVTLTDPDASRFFWTIDEAVNLIFECSEKATSSAPYIPTMKAVKMGVVLDACMEVYGRSPVKIIGLQPGENKVETTDGITFSDTAEQFTKDEFIKKFLS